MIKVGIVGATGMVGETLTKILLGHPQVEIAYLGSEHAFGKEISEVCPSLRGLTNLICQPIEVKLIAQNCDLVFLAKPHKEAMKIVPEFITRGLKVIDTSADFRLKDYKVYEKYYQVEHAARELLKAAVYGLPEIYRQELKKANLVALPGCYPTGVILGLAPLIAKNLAFLDSLIADAYSGLSGSGRTYNPKTDNLFVSCYGNIKSYEVGKHRHIPEMEQELSHLAKEKVKITFVPHVVPIDRGIHTTIFASLKTKIKTEQLLSLYQEFYQKEPFIRILQDISEVTLDKVAHTNFCDIGLYVDERTDKAIICTALDNLGKGAASQGIQDMNILCGFPEDLGLRLCQF